MLQTASQTGAYSGGALSPNTRYHRLLIQTEARVQKGVENARLVHANGPSQLWLLGWNHRRADAGHPLSLTGLDKQDRIGHHP